MTIAAPLLVLARPLGPLLWAFPARARSKIARTAKIAAYLLGWDILTLPLVAAILHGTAIWAWHLPVLFDAALRIEWVHWAQHLSFLVTALFFWWTIFAPLPRRRPSGGAIFTLFATSVHTGFLGILIALAPATIYPLQSRDAALWNLTPMSDQQLAGLIMWVPGGMIYFVAALALAALWISRSPTRPVLTPATAPRRA
jgi:cytochrome c oxidase assembly factor CtaG